MKNSLAAKIDQKVIQSLDEFCEERGLKKSAFIEKALIERMERIEYEADVAYMARLLSEPKEFISMEDLFED